MLDKRNWEGKLSSMGIFSVSCSLVGKTQDLKWHLIGIYAPNHRQEREETWGKMGAARGLFFEVLGFYVGTSTQLGIHQKRRIAEESTKP